MTHTVISSFVTARKLTFPFSFFKLLNSPTLSRKLSASVRALLSGMISATSSTESSCSRFVVASVPNRVSKGEVSDLVVRLKRRLVQLLLEVVGFARRHDEGGSKRPLDRRDQSREVIIRMRLVLKVILLEGVVQRIPSNARAILIDGYIVLHRYSYGGSSKYIERSKY